MPPFHPDPAKEGPAVPDIDPDRVRFLFGQGAPGRADFICREIATRMFERLDYIRIAPTVILDAGCGAGDDARALGARFPAAPVLALDLAAAASTATRRGDWLRRWLRKLPGTAGRAPLRLGGDLGALPVANASLEMIWSNLALHWHPAPHTVFPEWRRALRTNGLVLFSAFGPDTLKEVRDAFVLADPGAAATTHVAAFTDMHDYGDMLVEAGFATPVMDAERLTLTYGSAAALWDDVRALGGNAATARRHGLLGKQLHRRLVAALEAGRTADGRYRLSFEIVYGHAWKGQPRTTAAGEAIVRLERRPRPGGV